MPWEDAGPPTHRTRRQVLRLSPQCQPDGWHRALMPQHGGCGIRLDSHERGTQSEGASFLIAPVPGRPDLGHVVSHGVDQSDSRVVMVQQLLYLPEVSGLP